MSLTELFRSRLRVLNYPKWNQFNAEDSKEYRELVVWLEDQKVRLDTIKQRDPLRDVSSSDWDAHFQSYVERAQCPISLRKNAQTRLTWLLNRAVQLQYAQNPVLYNSKDVEETKSEHPLSGIDVKGDVFKSQVAELAKALKVSCHPDPLITFEACCLVIKNLVHKRDSLSKSKDKVQHFDLNAHPLGVSKELQNEPDLCQALKVLRLLNLKDLRELQDEINNTIEQIQMLTANPKTDTRLGQVGR